MTTTDLPGAPRSERASEDLPNGDVPGRRDPAIDPRIRDRRVAVLRAQGRRRLRILLGIVVALSVLGIGWLVIQSPFLAVTEVSVRGVGADRTAEVLRAAGVPKGDALLFVDTGAVAAQVEQVPWVKTARVSRELPHGLVIVVTERVPAAWIRRPVPAGSPAGTVGTIAVVDGSGRVIRDSPGPIPGLPEIAGITSVPVPGDALLNRHPTRSLVQLPIPLRAQAGALVLSGGEAVLRLATPPGGAAPAAGEVHLGPLDDVPAKGAAALAVLDALAAAHQHASYVDVRVPAAPATG